MADATYAVLKYLPEHFGAIRGAAKKHDLDTSDLDPKSGRWLTGEVYGDYHEFLAALDKQGIPYDSEEESGNDVCYVCRRFSAKGEPLYGVSEASDLPQVLQRLYTHIISAECTKESLCELINEITTQYAAFPLDQQQAINGKRYLMRQAVKSK